MWFDLLWYHIELIRSGIDLWSIPLRIYQTHYESTLYSIDLWSNMRSILSIGEVLRRFDRGES